MRHQYTPIFRDLLTSSLWATSTPATKCVWVVLLLDADPEGYVPMSIPGLAARAGVTIAEVETALEILEGADPYSRTKTNEGRRVKAVDHGWHILNFVAWRERSIAENEKARKRAWAKQNRSKPANDNATSSGSSETVDAPKPEPKPSSSSSSSTGECEHTFSHGSHCELCGFDRYAVYSEPLVLKRIPEGWQMGEELVAEAKLAGVQEPEKWYEKLKRGPIGGQRGVFAQELAAYIRDMFPKWRTWEETERAKLKAQRDAAAAPQTRFGRPLPTPVGPEATPKQRAFAARYGLDLSAIVEALVKRNYTTQNYQTKELNAALDRALIQAKRERDAA